jgi:hypothetical protein
MFISENILQVAIYPTACNQECNLVIEANDNTQQFIAGAESAEKLYLRAFELAHKVHKNNTLVYAIRKKNSLERQEQLSLGVGKGYRHRGDQDRASYYFSRANIFNKQRCDLEAQILSLMGLKLSQENLLKPVNNNNCMC